MWPDLIQKSKDGGLDVIETYVFWNLHEPVRNQVRFCEFVDPRAASWFQGNCWSGRYLRNLFTVELCFSSLEKSQ